MVLVGCMVTGRVVARAGPGAVKQFQPGMLFEVRGDLAGVVHAVVIADHRDHRGPRERLVEHAQQGDEVRRAARPSRHTHAAVLTSTAPSTVTLRFVPRVRTPGRRPRSVQLARTCGPGSGASPPAGRAGATRSRTASDRWSAFPAGHAAGCDACQARGACFRRAGQATWGYMPVTPADSPARMRLLASSAMISASPAAMPSMASLAMTAGSDLGTSRWRVMSVSM
jgi:hypothetical protein